jgi:hypothetical protein
VISGYPIAVRSQSISGVSAVNPLVGFYDILNVSDDINIHKEGQCPDSREVNRLMLNYELKFLFLFQIIQVYHRYIVCSRSHSLLKTCPSTSRDH